MIITKSTPEVRGEELPYEDGIPMESSWHRDAMSLLIDILSYYWRARRDVFIGGNMFVYFDPDQAKTRNFRGPDFFVVKGVSSNAHRLSWVVWEENGLTPDFVIELTSKSTEVFDKTGKKEIYEQILQTSEYVIYNPANRELAGWRLVEGHYIDVQLNERGWLWCDELELWLGVKQGQYLGRQGYYPRFFDAAGNLLPTEAEAEAQRAEAEAKARRAAEAEIAQLKAELEAMKRSSKEAPSSPAASSDPSK